MREKNLTLETAAEIARTAEAARKQLQQTARNQSVHGVQYKKGSQNQKKRFKNGKKDANANRGNSSDQVETQCRYCGSKHEKRNCPAYGKTDRKVRVVRKTTLRKCADQRTLVRLRIGLNSL